jgi:hypothetical protein
MGKRHDYAARPRFAIRLFAVTNCLCRGVASDLLLERNMQTFERYLKRWHDAGLIDDATESSIRIFEAADARPSGNSVVAASPSLRPSAERETGFVRGLRDPRLKPWAT